MYTYIPHLLWHYHSFVVPVLFVYCTSSSFPETKPLLSTRNQVFETGLNYIITLSHFRVYALPYFCCLPHLCLSSPPVQLSLELLQH